MPVNTIVKDSKLKLQFDGGVNGKGDPVVKSKTFSKVKIDAVNDNLFSVATSLADLQDMPLIAVKRLDEVELTQA
ncbi:Protein of unknown function [Proteiniborus ethanoligenes]|uniref:DUF1659 domain-containing protein n=1 Tax=Proteiniborus ethanoligenes TaxID=415015 RepID=A0A1H3LKT8_9FIRM|nr:DUF1659 domain-containing protein [Proteiniborus ethanoligenes]SDY64956.1 Protein of unknown function [Proteiniborus ethanoligenes]